MNPFLYLFFMSSAYLFFFSFSSVKFDWKRKKKCGFFVYFFYQFYEYHVCQLS